MRPRHWVIAGLVVTALGACFVYAMFHLYPQRARTPVLAEQLKVGDCVRNWSSGSVLPRLVKKARCDGTHFGEVFAVLTFPDAQDYPSEEAFKKFGENCGGEFFKYAPDIPDGPIFRVVIAYPRKDAWENGKRSVACVAMSKGERWSSIRD